MWLQTDNSILIATLKEEFSQDYRTTQTTCRARTNTEADGSKPETLSQARLSMLSRPLENYVSTSKSVGTCLNTLLCCMHVHSVVINHISVILAILDIYMHHLKLDVTILQQTCTQLHRYFQSSSTDHICSELAQFLVSEVINYHTNFWLATTFLVKAQVSVHE